ncbi:MAG: hypothetical protein A3E83_05760 [Gammaproteobacteria bacterium RIFCSPHIGHO2_12_FULL_41_20]|nr:MAG: hypothetical protein A3E83_05760 [Gammaproteobacteria bacterium RIFCSPHIGHO2_12_FULL_41_20]
MRLNKVIGFSLFILASIAQAAIPIDLSRQQPHVLSAFVSMHTSHASNALLPQLKEINRAVDFNRTLHVRVQEVYQGYPVWGGDAVLHIPQASTKKSLSLLMSDIQHPIRSMDGIIYQDMNADLVNTPDAVFSATQSAKALQVALADYQQRCDKTIQINHSEAQPFIYIDDNNKAHWAFLIHFLARAKNEKQPPEKPTYLIDAFTLQIYMQWNDMKTEKPLEEARGGGFGGNPRMGKLIYDGLVEHFPFFMIERDPVAQLCYLKNNHVLVQKCEKYNPQTEECLSLQDLIPYICRDRNSEHNQVYWNGDYDATNGAYSPSNDALVNAEITRNMYEKWVGVPVLINPDHTPMRLTMILHFDMDNAYWEGDSGTMNFGDGSDSDYPFTILDITAHEISHGFTEQHSNLRYYGQAGGMNESFSDIAGKAAEYYANRFVDWSLGSAIVKEGGDAFRYMDQPSKDCRGINPPGHACSIDDAMQYHNSLDVHHSSGVYNRFFYLLSTTPGWDIRKAFMLVVHANAYYWTSSANFRYGACGVLKATRDFGYDVEAVKEAFNSVQIDTKQC